MLNMNRYVTPKRVPTNETKRTEIQKRIKANDTTIIGLIAKKIGSQNWNAIFGIGIDGGCYNVWFFTISEIRLFMSALHYRFQILCFVRQHTVLFSHMSNFKLLPELPEQEL